MSDQIISPIAARIAALQAEVGQYKTVTVKWLHRQLQEILDNAPAAAPVSTVRERRPVPLLRFLGLSGGLASHGDLLAMDAHKKLVPGAGMLVRKSGGLTLDEAREIAEEAGYLAIGSDINALLDAVSEELAGRPVYSDRDLTRVIEMGEAARADLEAEIEAERVGETVANPYEMLDADAVPF